MRGEACVALGQLERVVFQTLWQPRPPSDRWHMWTYEWCVVLGELFWVHTADAATRSSERFPYCDSSMTAHFGPNHTKPFTAHW